MANTKLNLRNQVGKIKQRATVYITKQLEEEADLFELNVKSMIKNELEKKYVENVRASYSPRSMRGQEIKKYNEEQYREHRQKVTYRHTGIFANSIYTKIDGRNVKIMIRNEKYPDGASTLKVYRWLTKGTKGGNKSYPYIKMQGNNSSNPNSYHTGWSRNFATPAHLFEEHTRLQMQGYLETLKNDIENGNIKQEYQKYVRKKK